MLIDNHTIVAPATGSGGAIAIVRLSGDDAFVICDSIFRGKTPINQANGYTIHYGHVVDGDLIIDDVLVSVFRAPHSYTGENSVEISCHGSQYIVSEILRLCIAAGARMATPGEFTTRAYLAGKMDLSQAEAVADLIASSSRSAHALASTQMRGSYSSALDSLRDKLLNLTSLLELELDFSEEDVQFADRTELRSTIEQIGSKIDSLRSSFSLGNAIREGVGVAIVGAPNAGKSTLLNRLVGEERAMVSQIAGTTRDTIEQLANIDGVQFRFIDTAGIRQTDDQLEQMGIERTFSSISRAKIIIHLLDATSPNFTLSTPPQFTLQSDQTLITVVNKIDALSDSLPPAHDPRISTNCISTANNAIAISAKEISIHNNTIAISAKEGHGVDLLRSAIRSSVDTESLYHGDAVVSNTRHMEALGVAQTALNTALEALEAQLPTDLLSEEIRAVIRPLSAITGQIDSDTILQNIFSRFCIGK